MIKNIRKNIECTVAYLVIFKNEGARELAYATIGAFTQQGALSVFHGKYPGAELVNIEKVKRYPFEN